MVLIDDFTHSFRMKLSENEKKTQVEWAVVYAKMYSVPTHIKHNLFNMCDRIVHTIASREAVEMLAIQDEQQQQIHTHTHWQRWRQYIEWISEWKRWTLNRTTFFSPPNRIRWTKWYQKRKFNYFEKKCHQKVGIVCVCRVYQLWMCPTIITSTQNNGGPLLIWQSSLCSALGIQSQIRMNLCADKKQLK